VPTGRIRVAIVVVDAVAARGLTPTGAAEPA
jgi:hypothetical protein